MNIYILLLICGLATAVEDRGLWGLIQDVIHITHSEYVPEDSTLNITQLAKKYEYPLEEHYVHTIDGYSINIHRIPRKDGPVVFLMHGILESSDSWLLLGPGKALAYVLADEGFDVWMGNTRGNKHALLHSSMNTTMPKFWDFTWEEIALYDLPAMISYILDATRKENLYYVGHSQGTTSGYVMCAMKPEYNKKIKMMFSLAPEAWMGNVKSPLVRMFSPAYKVLGYLLQDFNPYSTGLDSFNKISAFVCSVMPGKCDNILYAISGYETKVKEDMLPIIMGHMPTGASTLQFVHYGQLVESKRFCRYDYGRKTNFEKYGRSIPPDYDLSNVKVPVVLFYSSQDWLSDVSDVEILKRHLPNVVAQTHLSDYTHIDYVYADDAKEVIYDNIMDLIHKFEKNILFKAKKEREESEELTSYQSSHRLPGDLHEVPTLWC